jgi:hypothetical protein
MDFLHSPWADGWFPARVVVAGGQSGAGVWGTRVPDAVALVLDELVEPAHLALDASRPCCCSSRV